MPTYEYACKKCGTELEAVQKFTDDALTECPSCGGELRKVFGNVGIVFKGSGFYKNDSRKASTSASAASSAASESTEKTTTTTSSSDATTTPAPAVAAAPSTPAATPSS